MTKVAISVILSHGGQRSKDELREEYKQFTNAIDEQVHSRNRYFVASPTYYVVFCYLIVTLFTKLNLW